MQSLQQQQMAPAVQSAAGTSVAGGTRPASPQALMNALNLLQQNIGALQTLIPLISQQPSENVHAHQLKQQQEAASAGVASVISQLAMAAANILPQAGLAPPFYNPVLTQHTFTQPDHQLALPSPCQGGQQCPPTVQGGPLSYPVQPVGCHLEPVQELSPCQLPSSEPQIQVLQEAGEDNRQSKATNPQKRKLDFPGNLNDRAPGGVPGMIGVHPLDDGDNEDEYSLPDGLCDIVEMDPLELLAEHTHFCEICGKGFKRDANLRMHMRGHGDEYKTPEALARPGKHTPAATQARPQRFSCPYAGCKRNQKHSSFLPLKTMLCVKNHYRRTHCPKMLACSKCGAKRFSVVADLKTHEKHCGRDRWMCSCGTSFSRKDKLMGHLALFRGHTPAAATAAALEEGTGANVLFGDTGPVLQKDNGMQSYAQEWRDEEGVEEMLQPAGSSTNGATGGDDVASKRAKWTSSNEAGSSRFNLNSSTADFRDQDGEEREVVVFPQQPSSFYARGVIFVQKSEDRQPSQPQAMGMEFSTTSGPSISHARELSLF